MKLSIGGSCLFAELDRHGSVTCPTNSLNPAVPHVIREHVFMFHRR